MLTQRSHVAVDDVASNEDQVGLLGIDHIHPTADLGTRVVESGMQVTQHDDLHGTFEGLIGREMDFLSLLVTVMDVAGDEDGEHHPGQHDGGDGIVTQP